jgi:hypothetical protein
MSVSGARRTVSLDFHTGFMHFMRAVHRVFLFLPTSHSASSREVQYAGRLYAVFPMHKSSRKLMGELAILMFIS